MAIDRDKITHLAERLVLQGKIDAAIAQYELLVKDNPREMNTINKIGDLYSRLGKKKEAILQFNKIGEHYAKDGFFLKAIAIYKKIAKLDPASIESYQRLADLYAQQGLVTEARSQYLFVAEKYLKSNGLKQAIKVYAAIGRLDPESVEPRMTMADLLAKDGRPLEAADEYQRVAEELAKRGKDKEARQAYRKAAELQPASPALLAKVAGGLVAGGDTESALKMVHEALKKPGDHTDLWILLAEIHLKAEKPEEAEADLQRAMDGAPARPEPRLLMARLHVSRGDASMAFEALSPSIDAMARAGKGGEVVGVLDEILALDERHKQALERLANLHAAMKQMEKATACRARLLDVCIDQGDLPEARKLAEALVKLRPGDGSLKERLALLRSTEGTGPGRAEAQPGAPEPQFERAAAGAGPAGRAETAVPLADPDEQEWSETEDIERTFDAMAAPGAATAALMGEAAVESPLSPLRLDAEDEDFIAEHMTEADVFVKYGLGDRATEQLRAVTQRYPGYEPAHLKLKEIFLEEGNRDAAREQMEMIVKAHITGGHRSKAEEALSELRRFDPTCSAAADLGALLSAGGQESSIVDPDAPAELSEFGEARAGVVAGDDQTLDQTPSPTSEDLEEVDFYLGQGLREEAVVVLRRLAERCGSQPEIVVRMRKVMGGSQEPLTQMPDASPEAPARQAFDSDEEEFEISVEEDVGAPASASQGEHSVPAAEGPVHDLLDLASEIDAALSQDPEASSALLSGVEAEPEGHSLDEIVQAFKKGVEEQVGPEDFETHYNLGIAYKEMGLLDEAIGEFQFASKGRGLLLDCCSMLGICFREKGMHALAVKWYRRGLEAGGGSDEESLLGLRYDLADTLSEIGEQKEAVAMFTEVYGMNSKYRDVAARIKELELNLGG